MSKFYKLKAKKLDFYIQISLNIFLKNKYLGSNKIS